VLTLFNDSGQPVEGLSAQLRLVDGDGDVVSRSIAYAPINLMPPDAHMPLVHFIDPSAPLAAIPQFSLISAVGSGSASDRYAASEISEVDQEQLTHPGHWAARGELLVPDVEEGVEFRTAVLVMGLDADGQIVGFSKWEAESGSGPPWDFEVEVFSLGPPIDHLELIAEVALISDNSP
jgi:hypothetical protein